LESLRAEQCCAFLTRLIRKEHSRFFTNKSRTKESSGTDFRAVVLEIRM
jgi:hypothetical protein